MHPDPRSADRPYYECPACGYREVTTERVAACPECDAPVRNLAVPRE